NFVSGRLAPDGVDVAGGGRILGSPPPGAQPGAASTAAVRPERVRLFPPADMANRVSGRVEAVIYHGLDLQLSIQTGLSPRAFLVRRSAADADRQRIEAGDPVEIGWEPADTRIFVD